MERIHDVQTFSFSSRNEDNFEFSSQRTSKNSQSTLVNKRKRFADKLSGAKGWLKETIVSTLALSRQQSVGNIEARWSTENFSAQNFYTSTPNLNANQDFFAHCKAWNACSYHWSMWSHMFKGVFSLRFVFVERVFDVNSQLVKKTEDLLETFSAFLSHYFSDKFFDTFLQDKTKKIALLACGTKILIGSVSTQFSCSNVLKKQKFLKHWSHLQSVLS